MAPKHILFILLALGSLVSCDSRLEETKLGDLKQEVEQSLKDAIRAVEGGRKEISSETQQELEKLFTFEYRVEELPASASSVELENRLATLGRERWECFHVERGEDRGRGSLRVFCKRTPKTYLRYIPRFF